MESTLAETNWPPTLTACAGVGRGTAGLGGGGGTVWLASIPGRLAEPVGVAARPMAGASSGKSAGLAGRSLWASDAVLKGFRLAAG